MILAASANMTHDLGWAHSPLLIVLHQVPHALQLRVQPHPVPGQHLQLLAQVANVALEDGLQVFPTVVQVQLLQKFPLGPQHLVLLLQEPHLESDGCCQVPWKNTIDPTRLYRILKTFSSSPDSPLMEFHANKTLYKGSICSFSGKTSH